MSSRENALLIVKEATAIASPERLGVGTGIAIDRRAATGSEDWCKLPATCEVADKSMLPLVPRIIDEGVDVVNELTIEVLIPIHIVEIERIVDGVLTRGLNKSTRTQSFTVSEVLLKGDVVPVHHLERDECTIVIAIADAGINADAAGKLPVASEC